MFGFSHQLHKNWHVYLYCARSRKSPYPPQECHWKFCGGGRDFQRLNLLKGSMRWKWNFQRFGHSIQRSSRVSIFSKTAHVYGCALKVLTSQLWPTVFLSLFHFNCQLFYFSTSWESLWYSEEKGIKAKMSWPLRLYLLICKPINWVFIIDCLFGLLFLSVISKILESCKQWQCCLALMQKLQTMKASAINTRSSCSVYCFTLILELDCQWETIESLFVLMAEFS